MYASTHPQRISLLLLHLKVASRFSPTWVPHATGFFTGTSSGISIWMETNHHSAVLVIRAPVTFPLKRGFSAMLTKLGKLIACPDVHNWSPTREDINGTGHFNQECGLRCAARATLWPIWREDADFLAVLLLQASPLLSSVQALCLPRGICIKPGDAPPPLAPYGGGCASLGKLAPPLGPCNC